MRFLFTFLLICIYAASTAQIPSYVPTNGLVGWWPFNGNANDESGNGNHGTVSGATLTSDRFGNVGKAYYFNGINNYIEVPDNNSLDITGNISISVWIYSNTLSPNRIIDKSTVGLADAYMLDLSGAESSIDRLRFIVANSYTGASQAQSSPNSIFSGQYYHILITYNQTNVQFYINGLLNNTFPQSGQSSVNNNPLRFGANSLLQQNWFNGILDDIAIYNRALTQQEITQLYNGTINPSTPEDTTSNVGIGTITPKRKLHVNDVMRLEPRNSAPANPGEGDIYYDAILKKLRYYNGTNWINL